MEKCRDRNNKEPLIQATSNKADRNEARERNRAAKKCKRYEYTPCVCVCDQHSNRKRSRKTRAAFFKSVLYTSKNLDPTSK